MYLTNDDGSQNMFVYQPRFNLLELRINKSTEYLNDWKSKSIYNSRPIALNGDFLPNIKYFKKRRVEMQFNDTPLVTEQNNYITKIVKAYIVHDLDN